MPNNLFVKYIKDKNSLINILATILVLLAINMLSNNIGLFNIILLRFFAFCLLFTFFLFVFLEKNICKEIKQNIKKKKIEIILGFIIILFSLSTLFSFNNRSLWLISIPIFLFGILIFYNILNIKNKPLDLLIIVSFIYALFIVFLDNTFFLWSIVQQISLSFTQVIGYIIGRPLLIGPSASGLWILISFLIFTTVVFLYEKKIIKFILCIFSLFIIWTIYILFQSLYSFNSTIELVNSQYIFFFLGLIPALVYLIKSKYLEKSDYPPIFKKYNHKYKSWFLILMIIFLFISSFCLATFFNADSNKGKIIINKYGVMANFEKPMEGVYGKSAPGMFGLLSTHLNEFGYDVGVINAENLTENDFENASVFVLININETFSDEEHKFIWAFVEKGGSLLVLGDHTDMDGMMTHFNNLLEPVGIRFRFDSAVPFNSDPQWTSCMQFLNHPITEGISNENQIGISIGASLDISNSSFPVIIGNYAFSDKGDYLNAGSNLGDYKYKPGEKLGDVILAAGAYYGQGKVLVFGDTSTFQNIADSQAYPLVYNVFKWLNNKQTFNVLAYQIIVSISLFMGAFLLHVFCLRKSRVFTIYPIITCIVLILSTIINPVLIGEKTIQGSIIYIDSSHGEKFNFDYYKDDSVDGLIINLARYNYSTYILYDFSEKDIAMAEALVLIAPTKSFDDKKITFLKQNMYDGLLVILSVGYQDKLSSEKLLKEFDLDIQNMPLGPVPLTGDSTKPEFVDSWPIVAEKDNDITSFYNVSIQNITYDLIVFKSYGEGGLLLIGDSQFLLDKNLESISTYHKGNIDFIKEIIKELERRKVLQ